MFNEKEMLALDRAKKALSLTSEDVEKHSIQDIRRLIDRMISLGSYGDAWIGVADSGLSEGTMILEVIDEVGSLETYLNRVHSEAFHLMEGDKKFKEILHAVNFDHLWSAQKLDYLVRNRSGLKKYLIIRTEKL